MRFGLTKAAATFHRALDTTLASYKWKTCLVYLDDVIVFSKTLKAHIEAMDTILSILQTAGTSLRSREGKWFAKELSYLGHLIKPGKLEMEQALLDAVREAQLPGTQTHLRALLGVCNV